VSKSRFSLFAVVALVALPVLSACTTSPGAAAIIGTDRITTGELQAQVNEAVKVGNLSAVPGFNLADFNRELLTHIISVRLTDAVAKNHHVSVTPQEISAQTAGFVQQAGGSIESLRKQAAQGGVSPRQLPAFIAYAALQSKLTSALIEAVPATPAELAAEYQKEKASFDQVQIAQIAVKTKAEAEHIRSQVEANPSSFASVAKAKSLDASTAAKGGQVGFVGRNELISVLGGADTAAKPGTFVIAHNGSTYSVVHIISRRVLPMTAVTAQLKQGLFASESATLLQKALQAEAIKLGVYASPRYGRWDNSKQQVVAVKSAVSSPG
jgi:PPIC-type PPIASE domain